MSFEGRMREHKLVRGQWRDSLLYAAVDSTSGTGPKRAGDVRAPSPDQAP
jgi:hypothetical protein